jgi:Na+/H+ antiporter NhaC
MEFLDKVKKLFTREFWSGLKTYVMGLLMIIQAIVGIFSGELNLIDAIDSGNLYEGLSGVALMTLRSGMKKISFNQ